MKCKLIRAMRCDPCQEFPQGLKPAGTLIAHADAYRLVQMGCAVPVDAQCRARAGLSDADIQERQGRYERLDRGVWPEDYEAYDAGLMIGYQPDGSWKPGPNHVAGCEEAYYAARLPAEDEEA